jgi:hypothetical protein
MRKSLWKKEIIFGVVIISIILFSPNALGIHQDPMKSGNIEDIGERIRINDNSILLEAGSVHLTNFSGGGFVDIIEIISQINESLIHDYLEKLVAIGPRYIGSNNCKLAAEYIFHEFEKLELEVSFDNFSYLRFASQNVIATYRGINSSSDAIIVLCAHYDTVSESPGANDDGSGIATILAIANICSQFTFDHTIKFIAFSGEEIMEGGSRNYAQKAYDRGENILAVFNLDGIGNAFTEKGGKTIQVYTPDRALWIPSFIQQFCTKYNEYIDLAVQTLPNHPCDQEPFTAYGYDSVMICQFDSFKNIIHSPNDTINNINFTYLTKITKTILGVTVLLAQTPIDLQVRFSSPRRGVIYLFEKPVFNQPKCMHSLEQIGMTYVLGRCTARLYITTSEEIENIMFGIDELFFLNLSPSATSEWKIQGYDTPLFGCHKIEVYVFTTTGKVAHDEMNICIVTLSHLYWPLLRILMNW